MHLTGEPWETWRSKRGVGAAVPVEREPGRVYNDVQEGGFEEALHTSFQLRLNRIPSTKP
jgi:hypothetical protein